MNNSLIGKRILEARTRMGISTQELANLIGKSQATISRIENGKQAANIILLNKIASVLQVHPFKLLGDDGATFGRGGAYGSLHEALREGRLRSKLDIPTVALEVGTPAENIEGFEDGSILPTAKQLKELCRLYPVDAKFLEQLLMSEQQAPLVSERLRATTSLLGECLNILQTTGGKVNILARKIAEFLGVDGAAEREGEYFSIGHLSDRLLRALQNPDFHQQMEDLAHKWGENQSESLREQANMEELK